MAAAEVIQVLQALDVKVLGMSAGEKKAELRAQVGLPREVDGRLEEKKEDVKPDAAKEGAKIPAQRTLPRIAPGSTAEKKGGTGTAAAEGKKT